MDTRNYWRVILGTGRSQTSIDQDVDWDRSGRLLQLVCLICLEAKVTKPGCPPRCCTLKLLHWPWARWKRAYCTRPPAKAHRRPSLIPRALPLLCSYIYQPLLLLQTPCQPNHHNVLADLSPIHPLKVRLPFPFFFFPSLSQLSIEPSNKNPLVYSLPIPPFSVPRHSPPLFVCLLIPLYVIAYLFSVSSSHNA